MVAIGDLVMGDDYKSCRVILTSLRGHGIMYRIKRSYDTQKKKERWRVTASESIKNSEIRYDEFGSLVG